MYWSPDVFKLGKKLTYGVTEEERNASFKETLLNIPLWKASYSKFGKNLPASNFWAKLTEISGLEVPDSKKAEEIVRNAYLDDFQYLKEQKKPENGDKGMKGQDNINTTLPKAPEGIEQLTLGANIKVWMPKVDKEAARKAIQLTNKIL